jgi:hypothetical protein
MRAFLVSRYLLLGFLMCSLALLVTPTRLTAQATISTGTIVGTLTDPSDAVVPNAKIEIVNKATAQTLNLQSSSAGTYTAGALLPGDYTVTVRAKGFKASQSLLTVHVGVVTNGDIKVEIWTTTTIVTVAADPTQIDSSQSTVQGTITLRQITQLPANGRNFLDLAALEPGVQIQDGGDLDPTKNGYSSISFAGRFGRTARIEVDGIDISDEFVGTTTQNIPQSAIQEFQVEQSSLDPSTELTSSGAVNVTTRTGTNQYHGDAFFYGRWHNVNARLAPQDMFMRRAQWGVSFGGPIVKDKLFIFMDWERTRQDLETPVRLSAPFAGLSGGFNGPFREHELIGRLDWNVRSNWRTLFRISYDQNRSVSSWSRMGPTYSPFANVNHVPVYVAGLDGTTGRFTHSIRFGYTHYSSLITDAVTGSGIFNPAPDVEIRFSNQKFGSGPNWIAPQGAIQHNKQIKYDGNFLRGSHIFRYGLGVNDIQGAGFANFFGTAPMVQSSVTFYDPSICGPCPGGDANPLNYPVASVVLGNGQGFFTEIPKFGLPGGGMFDTRFQAYFGDVWKIKPNLTLNAALRYVRDTGRSDADLPGIALLDQWQAGLGNRVNQPNKNFAPSLGLAWSPGSSGKTVIRAGAGLYYENAVFNNVIFERPGRLAQGLFNGTAGVCPQGSIILPGGSQVSSINGKDIGTQICGQPIGSVASDIAALQKVYQAATLAAGPQANGAYVGNALANGWDSTGTILFGPNYRTPFSWQFNLGVQRQIATGTTLSVDYVRNVGLHFLLGYDTNHIGDARYLNRAAALNAINATNASVGCPAGIGGIDCAITAGASIFDYAGNGLDSGTQYLYGFPAQIFGLTPDTGAAFPGINPNLGENQMLFPIGRSVYNALLVSLRTRRERPIPGVKGMNLVVNYALSRAVSQAGDQDLVSMALDYNNINHFTGPNGLDRTHQLSLFGVFDFAQGFRASFASRIASPLPGSLQIPFNSLTGGGEIFLTDVTGDGTIGDLLPGTNIGSFSRDITGVSALNSKITAYGNAFVGHLTPAGKALADAGLFTPQQLVQLGGVVPSIDLAPSGQLFNDSFISTDLQLSYLFKPHGLGALENLTIEPTIAFYNLFNVANYGGMAGALDGSAGSVNGTTLGNRTNLISLGSGVYGFGAPRMLEWGLKITF